MDISHPFEASSTHLTGMPHIPRIPLDLYESDPKQVLVYIENSRDNDRHREILLDKGIIETQVALHIETIIVSSRVRSDKDEEVDLNGVPIVPNVKIVVDWQATLDMLLLFKGEKLGAFLGAKRVKMSLELVQKLHNGHEAYRNTKIGVTHLLGIGCTLDHLHLRNVIRPRIVL